MSLCAFYLAYLQSDIKNSQNSYHVPGLCIHNASCSMFFAEKVCPEGWRMFCHSCYVLSEKLGSWDEGRDDCRSKGADLVVIESLEDKTFISSYIKERAWIGLNDKEEEGNWKWVDGTPLTLQNWVAKQPDNGDGNPKWGEEDCVHVEPDASWNDLSCSASLKWICEKHTTE
uniref:C-type lectin domain-containing protein n=2 Tax=Oreochromis TaxID=8139 RepID=A0A669F848_ORENI